MILATLTIIHGYLSSIEIIHRIYAVIENSLKYYHHVVYVVCACVCVCVATYWPKLLKHNAAPRCSTNSERQLR